MAIVAHRAPCEKQPRKSLSEVRIGDGTPILRQPAIQTVEEVGPGEAGVE